MKIYLVEETNKNIISGIITVITAAVVTVIAVIGGLAVIGVFGGQRDSEVAKVTLSMDSLLNRNEVQKSSGMLIAVAEIPADEIEQMILDTVEYWILSAKDGTAVLEIKAVDMQAVVDDVESLVKTGSYQESGFSKAKEDASTFFKSAIERTKTIRSPPKLKLTISSRARTTPSLKPKRSITQCTAVFWTFLSKQWGR